MEVSRDVAKWIIIKNIALVAMISIENSSSFLRVGLFERMGVR
jgi:hypothetical protein